MRDSRELMLEIALSIGKVLEGDVSSQDRLQLLRDAFASIGPADIQSEMTDEMVEGANLVLAWIEGFLLYDPKAGLGIISSPGNRFNQLAKAARGKKSNG